MTTFMVIKFHQLIATQQNTNKGINFLLYNHKLQMDQGAMLGKFKSHNLFNAIVETKRISNTPPYSIITSLTRV